MLTSKQVKQLQLNINVKPSNDYYTALYGDTNGLICLMSSKQVHNGNFQYFGNIKSIKKIKIDQHEDYWSTVNTINPINFGHRTPYLANGRPSVNLNGFYVDLDLLKAGIQSTMADPDYHRYYLKHIEPILPIKPTIVNFTGHGLQLIFRIEPIFCNSNKILNLWRRVETALIAHINASVRFKDEGIQLADPSASDPLRLLRCVLKSNNCKQPDVIPIKNLIVDSSARYTLNQLSSILLPPIKTYTKSIANRKQSTIVYTSNQYTLSLNRVNDLLKLIELRQGKMNGHREYILFLIANFLKNNPIQRSTVYKANSMFTEPLSIKEIDDKLFSSAQQSLPIYKYKNTTLIDKLAITADEEAQLTTIKAITKKQQQAIDSQAKKANRKRERLKIRRAHRRGKSIADLVKETGLSRSTIKRMIA